MLTLQPTPPPATDPLPADLLDPPPPIVHHGPRVLLIEDDPLQSRALLRLLGTHGLTVHHVATAAAGLQALATQPPYHAIISDLLLPDLSGDEFARRIHGPLTVAYSGLDRFSPWFDACLTKPAVAPLLRLLRSPRISLVITSDQAGVYSGHCRELGLRCRGSSPVEVLRLLWQVMEERLR